MSAARPNQWTAQIPVWLKNQLDDDARVLGRGTTAKGGNQKVSILAFSMYLAIPEQQRVRLAERMRAASEPEELVKSEADAAWPVEFLKSLAAITPTQRAQIMATIADMIKRKPLEKQAPLPPTGHEQGRRKRAQGAA